MTRLKSSLRRIIPPAPGNCMNTVKNHLTMKRKKMAFNENETADNLLEVNRGAEVGEGEQIACTRGGFCYASHQTHSNGMIGTR